LKVIKCVINCEILFQFGRTALHFAAKKGHVDIVKYLVENGASLNSMREVRLDMCNITPV